MDVVNNISDSRITDTSYRNCTCDWKVLIHLLINFRHEKSSGPYGLHSRLLTSLTNSISRRLTMIFDMSISETQHSGVEGMQKLAV